MQNNDARVIILATGGTIAGTAARADDNVAYRSAQLGAADLVAAVPPLAAVALETEQVAQLDSKDMDHATWQRLARRAAFHLARPEVSGVVVTHGTDTLEETAWFLHRVLAPAKPLVLTAAMRPASSLQADGPQNLLDAVTVARTPGVKGVLAVLAGRVHGAADVRKWQPYRIDAFSSGDAGPLALIEEGHLRCFRPWPVGEALGLEAISADPGTWPWIEVLTSHAGARRESVDALVAAGVQGLVLAATGNGTLHHSLQAALDDAAAGGLPVWRTTRCVGGALVGETAGPAGAMSPWQARTELLLQVLSARGAGGPLRPR
jgi:L-asparaginase